MPVDLPTAGSSVSGGAIVTVTGWSNTTSGGIKPDTLQSATFSGVGFTTCQNNLTELAYITAAPLCTNACHGDFGDPVILNNTDIPNHIVAIRSFDGSLCNPGNSLAVYLFLGDASVRGFIQSVTGL